MLINIRPLVRHRDFRLLYFGQGVSLFGSMITMVALPIQAYQLTGSSFHVGLLSTVQLVPLLVFALWGGAVADTLDRRKLLLGSELFLALCSMGLAVHATLAHQSVGVLYVIAALMAAVNGFHRPALDALTPRLVEKDDLTAVSALGSLRWSVGAIAGPAAGGWCVARFGMSVTYGIDFLSFGASVLAIALIRRGRGRTDQAAGQESMTSVARIREGFRYAIRRPELVGTYIVDMVAMTFAMPTALFPALAAKAWGGTQAAGYLFMGIPLGAFGMSVLSGWSSQIRRQGAAVVLAAGAWGVGIVMLAYARTLEEAVACLAFAGAADMVSGLFRGAIWNETIPGHLRGRLAGMEMISYMSGPILGNTRAGWVAGLAGDRFSILSGGVTCVIAVAITGVLLPRFWRYTRGV